MPAPAAAAGPPQEPPAGAADALPPGLIAASLVGGAIGDALGAGLEFLPLAAIRRRFPAGFADLPPAYGTRGAITDDTQMTLFTAEALIRAEVARRLGEAADPVVLVDRALRRWAGPQLGAPPPEGVGLIADPRLHARRAPGHTCLSALAAARPLGRPAENDSKGCGTIMRVAAVALMTPHERVRDLAIATSALTHGHPTAVLAAAAWAELLAGVARGAPLVPTVHRLAEAYRGHPGGAETAAAIEAALAAPRDGRPETVERLGAGWTAEEALAIALYAVLCARGLEEGLAIAVTHGGDSDSTGAIAGNLLGLLFPAETLSHRWAAEVEALDLIARLVRDYARLCADEAGAAAALRPHYPPD